MKDRIATSVFWLAWSRGVVQVLSLLSTLAVARILSPADYGLMALAGIWTYIPMVLADLGLGPAIVQFQDLEESELNACFWLTMAVAMGAYLFLYAAAPMIAAWFEKPALASVLRTTGLSLPLTAARIVPDSLLRKQLALDKISQADLATVLTIPVVLGMAWFGAGVWALVVGSLLTPLIQNVIIFWFVRWRPSLRAGSKRFREILRFSLATLGSRVSWAALQQADTFILGKVVSDSLVLGYYSMAKQIASLPVDKLSAVINQFTYPIMAGLQADGAEMRRSFLRVLRLVACLTLPVCLAMALLADDLVYFMLGPKWLPAVPVLRVLCLFGLLRSLDVLIPPVLLARYRAAFLFRWSTWRLPIMSFAFWAGAAAKGALGVSLGWVVVYPFISAWIVREGLRELEIDWSTIVGTLRPVICAVLMTGGFVFVVRWAVPGSDLVDRLVRTVLTPVLGVLVYGAGIFWWARPVIKEFAEVTGWILRPSHLPSGRHRVAPYLPYSSSGRV